MFGLRCSLRLLFADIKAGVVIVVLIFGSKQLLHIGGVLSFVVCLCRRAWEGIG